MLESGGSNAGHGRETDGPANDQPLTKGRTQVAPPLTDHTKGRTPVAPPLTDHTKGRTPVAPPLTDVTTGQSLILPHARTHSSNDKE